MHRRKLLQSRRRGKGLSFLCSFLYKTVKHLRTNQESDHLKERREERREERRRLLKGERKGGGEGGRGGRTFLSSGEADSKNFNFWKSRPGEKEKKKKKN